MAISGYYYEVDREADWPRLVRAFERSLARMGGSPLTPVSSVGAVIDVVSYKDAMQANGAALGKLERSTGARKEAIDEQRMLALVVTRQQADVPKRASPRVARKGPAGTGGPYDWHLLETRTVAAWKLFDDARGGISWDGIRVGQIDTGYTEHVALGFSGATSPWVDTLHDYNYMAGHAAGYADPGRDFPFNERAEVAIDPLGGLNGGRLITLSMGAPHPWPILSPVKFPIPKALCDAIDYAYERGVFFFCAAGNNIPNPDVVNPARLNRTIAVAGTTRDEWPWSGSSRGAQVEISAPADQIHRAERLRNGNDTYGVGDGTSYATPQVCAAAALWLALARRGDRRRLRRAVASHRGLPRASRVHGRAARGRSRFLEGQVGRGAARHRGAPPRAASGGGFAAQVRAGLSAGRRRNAELLDARWNPTSA